MKTVIYLDSLLLVNFVIGYFLVRGAALLAKRVPGGSAGSRQHADSFGAAASGLGTVSVSGQ